MSFNYEYKLEQLEEYVRTNMGDFTRINLTNLLLSLINGDDHVEHIRDWINEYTQEEKA
jgi:hypothetical protein